MYICCKYFSSSCLLEEDASKRVLVSMTGIRVAENVVGRDQPRTLPRNRHFLKAETSINGTAVTVFGNCVMMYQKIQFFGWSSIKIFSEGVGSSQEMDGQDVDQGDDSLRSNSSSGSLQSVGGSMKQTSRNQPPITRTVSNASLIKMPSLESQGDFDGSYAADSMRHASVCFAFCVLCDSFKAFVCCRLMKTVVKSQRCSTVKMLYLVVVQLIF